MLQREIPGAANGLLAARFDDEPLLPGRVVSSVSLYI